VARGRFISNQIITDRQVHELSNDTCRLAYTWLITLADREGRVIGEPDMLAAQLFPRRREITPKMIEDFIIEWIEADFVIWYIGEDGDRVLQLVNFEKHQVGLRKEREAESIFCNPDESRIIAGVMPEKVPVNINDNNNSNDNGESDSEFYSSFRDVWEKETGKLIAGFTEFYKMCDRFKEEGVTPDLYRTAIKEQQNSDYPVKNPTSVETWAIRLAKSEKLSAKEKQKYIGPNGEVMEL
jgi:hypothetical protein